MNFIKVIEMFTLPSLIILAIATVQTGKLRRSVIYLGAFSLLSSLVYLMYNAPDVAISEAFIGCTISVVLFLVALKKFKILNIYYASRNSTEGSNEYCRRFVASFERFLVKNDFEPQKIVTSLDDEALHDNSGFDILIANLEDSITVYSNAENYHTNMLKEYVENYDKQGKIVFVSLVDEDI